MPYYRVLLHGEKIRIEPKDKSALRLAEDAGSTAIEGFYTTRIVNAPGEDAAVASAICSALDELAGYGFDRINRGAKPVFDAESIERIGLLSYLFAKPRRGFTFY